MDGHARPFAVRTMIIRNEKGLRQVMAEPFPCCPVQDQNSQSDEVPDDCPITSATESASRSATIP